MPSFTIAECPPSLAAATIDAGFAGGKLSLTVRNASDREQTARIAVQSKDADTAWFAIEGAPATRANLLERDFAPGATQTIVVSVKAPRQPEEKSYTFQVTVTAEERPDEDHAEGPAVRLTVPALEATPEEKRCRWCKPAIAAAVVLTVGLAGWYFLRPPPELPEGLEGLMPEAAVQRLIDAGFEREDIVVREDGRVLGRLPGTIGAIATSQGGRRVTLEVDPGVRVDAQKGTPVEDAVVKLLNDGLAPEVARVGAEGVPFFRVETVTPAHGEVLAGGTAVNITTFVPQTRPMPPNICERINCGEVFLEPSQVPTRFIRPELAPNNRIARPFEPARPQDLVVEPNR